MHHAEHLALRLGPVLGLVEKDSGEPGYLVVVEVAISDQETGTVLQRFPWRLPWRLRMEAELRGVAEFEATGGEVAPDATDTVDRFSPLPEVAGDLDSLALFVGRISTLGAVVLGGPSTRSCHRCRRLEAIAFKPFDRPLAGLVLDQIEDAAGFAGLIVGEQPLAEIDPHAA